MDGGVVALRFGLYLDLMLLFGLAAFGLHGLRGDERRSGAVLAFRPWLGALALVGALLSAMAFLAMVAGMAGTGIADLDAATVRMTLTGGAIGLAFQIRVAALALALVAVVVRGPGRSRASPPSSRPPASRSAPSPGRAMARWTRASPAGSTSSPTSPTCLAPGSGSARWRR